MNRNRELRELYGGMLRGTVDDPLETIAKSRVAGEWYLLDSHGAGIFVEQLGIQEIEHFESKGYTIAPVDVFRKK